MPCYFRTTVLIYVVLANHFVVPSTSLPVIPGAAKNPETLSLSLRVRVTNRKNIGMAEKLLWDLLPEEFPYQDEGCDLFPSCLNCPFPSCLEEEPWGKEKFLKVRRAQRMLELKREGKSVKDIARIFEVSPRTVWRWLKVVGT